MSLPRMENWAEITDAPKGDLKAIVVAFWPTKSKIDQDLRLSSTSNRDNESQEGEVQTS